MKYNAKDTTILILYRGDSLQRLENVIAVINNLHSFFDINIYVREADAVCNNILSMTPPYTKHGISTICCIM